jgi:glycosyltransferase involved in cell wall biosynthesis
MKKKIVYLVNHSSFFVSHRFELALEVSKTYEVLLIFGKESSNITEPKAINLINKYNIRYKKININNTGFFRLLDFFGYLKFIYIIIKFRPNIVHSISPLANLIAGLSLIFFKNIKLIISISGMGFIFTGENFIKKIISSIYIFLLKIVMCKKKLQIIIQNSDDYNFFNNNFNLTNKLNIIHGSGVDLSLFENIDYNTKENNIIFPARLIKEKGVIEFLQASKIVKQKFNNWNFLILGQFDYKSPSLLNVNNLKKDYNKYVNFIGYKNSIHDILKKSSIVCLPSYREGMPKVILEGSAAGCAIITTNVTGCRESIIDNYSGELIEPKNFIALSDKMIKFIKNRDLRIKYGNNARNYALKYYSVKLVIQKHLEIYKK